ncbi:hypothetical protein B0H13DRAFT_2321577 [Mycena leptocephala]|nr:hypothetical protein B0H13DRAFT_2321577 [Mycena leptocephala]
MTYTEFGSKCRFEKHDPNAEMHPLQVLETEYHGRPRMRIRFYNPRHIAVCRIQMVYPRHGDVFYLRTLLLHRSARDWVDLRTIDGIVYATYQEAARAMSLFDNRDEDSIGDDYLHDSVDLEHLNHTQSVQELINFVFPPSVVADPAICIMRAILSPFNVFVDEFNSTILHTVSATVAEPAMRPSLLRAVSTGKATGAAPECPTLRAAFSSALAANNGTVAAATPPSLTRMFPPWYGKALSPP